MANEIQVDATLQFTKGLVSNLISVKARTFLMTGINYIRESMHVPITAGGTALPLGSIGTPGWFMIVNNDPTNFVTVLSGVGGTALLKLLPGEIAIGRFSVATPAVLANTAICDIDYLIIEN